MNPIEKLVRVARTSDFTSMNPRWKSWLKRFGIAGFLFFLLKGIGWLVVFYVLGRQVID
jgi:DMSO reductase anchor subunit